MSQDPRPYCTQSRLMPAGMALLITTLFRASDPMFLTVNGVTEHVVRVQVSLCRRHRQLELRIRHDLRRGISRKMLGFNVAGVIVCPAGEAVSVLRQAAERGACVGGAGLPLRPSAAVDAVVNIVAANATAARIVETRPETGT